MSLCHFITPLLGVDTSSPLPQFNRVAHMPVLSQTDECLRKQSSTSHTVKADLNVGEEPPTLNSVELKKLLYTSVTNDLGMEKGIADNIKCARSSNIQLLGTNSDVLHNYIDHLENKNAALTERLRTTNDPVTLPFGNVQTTQDKSTQTSMEGESVTCGGNEEMLVLECGNRGESFGTLQLTDLASLMLVISNAQSLLESTAEELTRLRSQISDIQQTLDMESGRGTSVTCTKCENPIRPNSIRVHSDSVEPTSENVCQDSTVGPADGLQDGQLDVSFPIVENCHICLESSILHQQIQEIKEKVECFSDHELMVSVTNYVRARTLDIDARDREDDFLQVQTKYKNVSVLLLQERNRAGALEQKLVDETVETSRLQEKLISSRKTNEELLGRVKGGESDLREMKLLLYGEMVRVKSLEDKVKSVEGVVEEREGVMSELRRRVECESNMYVILSRKCYQLHRFVKLLCETLCDRITNFYINKDSRPVASRSAETSLHSQICDLKDVLNWPDHISHLITSTPQNELADKLLESFRTKLDLYSTGLLPRNYPTTS